MQNFKINLAKLNNYIDSINTTSFVSGLSAMFVGAFFLSVFFLDKDFSSRVKNQTEVSNTLEIYRLDTESIDIPLEVVVEYKNIPIYIVDIKTGGDLPTS